MLTPHHWLRTTLLAGRHMLLPAGRRAHRGFAMNSIVPIRALGAQHRERVANHLLALTERDRYLRFGYSASDEQVRRYAELLDFERDEVFGIFNRRLQLIAMAHVAYAQSEDTQSCAEFGVSVLASARGRGYGGLLFDRADSSANTLSAEVIEGLDRVLAELETNRPTGLVIRSAKTSQLNGIRL